MLRYATTVCAWAFWGVSNTLPSPRRSSWLLKCWHGVALWRRDAMLRRACVSEQVLARSCMNGWRNLCSAPEEPWRGNDKPLWIVLFFLKNSWRETKELHFYLPAWNTQLFQSLIEEVLQRNLPFFEQQGWISPVMLMSRHIDGNEFGIHLCFSLLLNQAVVLALANPGSFILLVKMLHHLSTPH